MLRADYTSRTEIESLHGCLNYVADVEPFGRPFLAQLIALAAGRKKRDRIVLSRLVKRSLELWFQILQLNKGISIDFLLNKIPHCDYNIFVDASSS